MKASLTVTVVASVVVVVVVDEVLITSSVQRSGLREFCEAGS